jgi:hypothetical protein
MRRLVLVLLLAAWLLAPVTAPAAIVAYDTASTAFTVRGEDGPDDLRIDFDVGFAGPLEPHAYGRLDVIDPILPVSVAPGSQGHCRAIDDHHVHCEGTPILHAMQDDLTVMTGAGDDRVSLAGSTAGAVLDGGPGRDALGGGGGADVLRVANDGITDGDAFDGGPGTDAVEVRGVLPEAVEVDLAAGRLTSPRGTERLTAVEDASASAPGVTLLGDDGPNVLMAGPGDRVDGRGGDDRLDVSEAASAACGPGRDVASGGPLARPADCEGSPAWFGFLGGVTVRGRTMVVGLAPSQMTGCGLRVQARTSAGRAVTAAIRTRGLQARSVRLPVRISRVPAVVHVAVALAVGCPRRGRPWRFTAGHPASAVALR